jgi:hypothetical protein
VREASLYITTVRFSRFVSLFIAAGNHSTFIRVVSIAAPSFQMIDTTQSLLLVSTDKGKRYKIGPII